jgi:hypothetical protein
MFWTCDALHPQKLALSSPTSSGRSVGIVRSRTEATVLCFGLIQLRIGTNGGLLVNTAVKFKVP